MERVALLIDGNNLAYGSRRFGVVVNYGNLLVWVSRGGPRKQDGSGVGWGLSYPRQIAVARVYIGPSRNGSERRDDTPSRNGSERRDNFIRMVQSLGFEVVISAEEGDETKTAVDRDMIMDALTLAHRGAIDRLVLGTGDGGFTRMVRALKELGVQVEVCAFPDASEALREAANFFWDLTALAGVTMVRGGSGGCT